MNNDNSNNANPPPDVPEVDQVSLLNKVMTFLKADIEMALQLRDNLRASNSPSNQPQGGRARDLGPQIAAPILSPQDMNPGAIPGMFDAQSENDLRLTFLMPIW